MSLSRTFAMFGGIAALGLLACSAFSSSDPSADGAETSATDAAAEGQPRDAATADAPVADAPAAGKNLLSNGNFELPCAAGWGTNSANVVEETTTTPHGGTRSCRVCGTVSGSSFMLTQEVPLVHGKTYVGEVFLRAPTPADDASAATSIQPGFLIQDTTNNNNLDTQFSAETALTDNWQSVGALIHANVDGGAHLLFAVQAVSGCFLIDDARVYEMP